MTNQRLVWNFELNTHQSMHLPEADLASVDTHWESRFFWEARDIITLSRLNADLLNLSRYKIKHRTDLYYLLKDKNYNIKKRKACLSYKPLMKQTTVALSYGKKINHLPDDFLQEINHANTVEVEKECLSTLLDESSNTSLELTRLTFNAKVYFCLNIESKSLVHVSYLAEPYLATVSPSDYITFLKQHVSCT